MVPLLKQFSRYIAPGSMNRQKYTRCFSMLHGLRGRRQLRESGIQERNFSQAIKTAHMFNPGRFPLLESTVGQLLDEAAEKWPDRTCVVSAHQNFRLTFSELLRRVDKLAAGFKKLGMQKGDRLAIWGPNDLEWLLTSLAMARIGGIIVAINPNYEQSELLYSLQKVNVKAIMSPERFKAHNYPEMLLAAKKVYPTLEHIIIWSQNHVA